MQQWSGVILRIGIGLVMLWFGFQQLTDPASWTSFLPPFIKSLPISEITFIYLNGWFELIFGLLLIVGFQTRIVGLFLALHMFGIISSVGYNSIGVRDFGLAIALVAIFLQGESVYGVDEFLRKKKSNVLN